MHVRLYSQAVDARFQTVEFGFHDGVCAAPDVARCMHAASTRADRPDLDILRRIIPLWFARRAARIAGVDCVLVSYCSSTGTDKDGRCQALVKPSFASRLGDMFGVRG